jgi:tetratricopeptide (TPR) repeat protein
MLTKNNSCYIIGTGGMKMKNIILPVLFSFLVFGCVTTNVRNNEPFEDTTEYKTGGNIKLVGPSAMVAPTKNEQARIAYNRGTEFMYANKLDEAERRLKEAIDLDPLFVDAIDHLGRVYRMQNRLSETEEMYLKSIEINDKNLVPYLNLAVVYRLQNRLNEAFELYRKAADIDVDDPEPYYGTGELFYIVGNYENSLLFFDKALELYIKLNSPLIYDVFYYKGMVYYAMGNYDEALRYLEEVQKGKPDNKDLKKTIDEIKNKKL